MSIPKFDVRVLDAILFPATNEVAKSKRKEAEAHYSSLSIVERTQGLLDILIRLNSNATTNESSQHTDGGRMNLAAVLLRKEISKLAGDVIKQSGSPSSFLLSMVDPLLVLYSSQKNSILDRQSRRALSHCLAEICLSLSLIATHEETVEAIRMILSRIGSTCAAGEALSLNLLSNMAKRAPVAFWASANMNENDGQIGHVLTAAITSVNSKMHQQSTNYIDSLESLMEAIFEVGIASGIAETAAQSGESAAIAEVSNAIYSQIKSTAGSHNHQPIQPNSFASQLGQSCLAPLLTLILTQQPNNNKYDELCRKCTQHLTDCASRVPSLLAGSKSTFVATTQACLHMGRMTELELETRLSAIEVLATLMECSDAKKVVMMEADKTLLTLLQVGSINSEEASKNHNKDGVLGICVQAMIDGVDEDVSAWSEEKPAMQDDAVWEEDDAAIFAESLLERILHSIGGNSAFPVLLPMLEALVASPDWKHQRAALAVMEQCLSASITSFAVHIHVVVEAAITLGQNAGTNSRVQWQCMQLLGVLCMAEQTTIVQKKYVQGILSTITCLIRADSCSKVVSHACLALVSFCRGKILDSSEGIDAILQPYVKDILEALSSGPLAKDYSNPLSLSSYIPVLIRALGAVACLAGTIKESFIPFYNNFMPALIACAGIGFDLKGALDTSFEDELSNLRGAALESATIVGESISGDNSELFTPDAEKIMLLALPIISHANVGAYDCNGSICPIPFDQLLAACARIASVMKDRFVPFLPSVIPLLLKRASQKANVSVSEGDEEGLAATQVGSCEQDPDKGTESVTVSVPGIGLKKLTMNTSQMQEIAQAARATYEFANALGSSFAVHAEACMDVFLPLVHFKYSSEVRSTCGQALTPIFNSLCEAAAQDESTQSSVVPYLQRLLPSICKSLLQELKKNDDEDPEILFAFAESLSEILYSAFSTKNQISGSTIILVDKTQAHEITKDIVDEIKECLMRRSKFIINGGNAINEDEKHDYEQLLDSESQILSCLVDSIGYILKILGPSFCESFDNSVVPLLQPCLTKAGTPDARARFAAICLFDDCIEYCGKEAATKHARCLLQGILEGIDDSSNENDLELMQASIYGIAQITRFAPPSVLSPVALRIIKKLADIARPLLIQCKDEDDNLSVMENSISALASLVLLNESPFESLEGVDKKSLMQMFLQALPLAQDYNEAKICHDGLCNLIECGKIGTSDVIVTSNIFRIFGECVSMIEDGEEVVSNEVYARFPFILKKIHSQIGDEQMQSIFLNLSAEVQTALRNLL